MVIVWSVFSKRGRGELQKTEKKMKRVIKCTGPLTHEEGLKSRLPFCSPTAVTEMEAICMS